MQIVPMTTTVAVRDEMITTEEEQALVGFLAGYGGLTREAYQLDLRQWVQWCTERQVALFGCAPGRHRRLRPASRGVWSSSSHGRPPALHDLVLLPLRRRRRAHLELAGGPCPATRLDYESHATGLDRNEVGAMLVAAGLGGAQDHTLLSLLALNGLRVSEAIGVNIERLGLERGHRT